MRRTDEVVERCPRRWCRRARPEMGDLSGPQRKAAMGLMAATLSQRGYEKSACDRRRGRGYLQSRQRAREGRCSGRDLSTFQF